jgi:hypothetical protein
MVGKSRSGEEGVDVCPLLKASLRRDAKMGSSMLDHEFEDMVGALYERFFDETAAEVVENPGIVPLVDTQRVDAIVAVFHVKIIEGGVK